MHTLNCCMVSWSLSRVRNISSVLSSDAFFSSWAKSMSRKLMAFCSCSKLSSSTSDLVTQSGYQIGKRWWIENQNLTQQTGGLTMAAAQSMRQRNAALPWENERHMRPARYAWHPPSAAALWPTAPSGYLQWRLMIANGNEEMFSKVAKSTELENKKQ